MKQKTKFKETEIGMIPEDWEIKTMKECVDLVIDYRGKTPKKLGSDWSLSGFRALSARNIKNGQIVNEENIRHVDEGLYNKWMKDEIHKEDIFLTSEGPMGEFMFWDSEEKVVLSQRVFGIRAKKEIIYPRYFYSYITSATFQRELSRRATGTTVQGVRQSELLKIKIILPSFKEQITLGDWFYYIDRKIELNHQMNKTLEAIGQAIFKRWFVDFEFPGYKKTNYQHNKICGVNLTRKVRCLAV